MLLLAKANTLTKWLLQENIQHTKIMSWISIYFQKQYFHLLNVVSHLADEFRFIFLTKIYTTNLCSEVWKYPVEKVSNEKTNTNHKKLTVLTQNTSHQPEKAIITANSIEGIVNRSVDAFILVERLYRSRFHVQNSSLSRRIRQYSSVTIVQESGILVVCIHHVHCEGGIRGSGWFAVVLCTDFDVEGFKSFVV